MYETQIWHYLTTHGMTEAGAAGMMGNLQAESGMIPNRVEILCLKRLKEAGKIYTDATYTAFVDDGTITREQFLHPLPNRQYGYGLCQWTTPGRKAKLYDLCKSKHVSIGDLDTQLTFLIEELQTSYISVWKILITTTDIKTASDIVLTKFEMPANTGSAVKNTRYGYSKAIYDKYSNATHPPSTSSVKEKETSATTPTQKGDTAMTEAQAIDKVLSIALAEEGYLEKASDKDLYSKTANPGFNNYQKYGKEMHALQPSNMDYPAAYCDAFVDWCMYKAFGADIARKVLCGTFDDYTVNSAGYYKNAGRWTTTPKRGHQIFFRNSGGICHTGLVWKVDGNKVYTIEGNKNNAVRKMEYYTFDSSIAGYGMPRYNLVTGEAESEEVNYKYTGTCDVKMPQLIKGDYGPAVKSLQTLLKQYGYKGKDGKVLTLDGEFGTNTEYAVANLQKHAGMTNINFGTVSSRTWELLIK